MSLYKTYRSEWNSWRGMLDRCNNPNHMSYAIYGGRGIDVCEEWKKFEIFLRDMGIRPNGFTLERTNNALGYFPQNCKWASRKEQNNNRRPRRMREDTKGYRWRADCNKYQAVISINNRSIPLGSFNTPEEARQSYLTAWANRV